MFDTERHIIIVDVETTGLDPRRHKCVEVAWWNLHTNDRECFVPTHDIGVALAGADIKALQINRYIDRIADRSQDVTGDALLKLASVLHGNTLAGSNPCFDAAWLRQLFDDRETMDIGSFSAPSWHHRLWDLSAYAAGALHLNYLPGLFDVCTTLGIDTPDHTAEGDVTATGKCFTELFKRVETDDGP